MSGRRIRTWINAATPPLVIDDNAVMVAYLASAEVGCFIQLGWPIPKNVIDLCAEFSSLPMGGSIRRCLAALRERCTPLA